MRTELTIVASPDRSPRISAVGGLAARITGRDTVHVIGTAATPLGGDHWDVTVRVLPGARLTLRSVAASLALPGRGRVLSTAQWSVEVEDDAVLDCALEPTVIAGGAEHRVETTVNLAESSTLLLRERVQIGRAGETTGRWVGVTNADLGALPLLRHQLELGVGTVSHDVLDGPAAVTSELRYPDDRPADVSGDIRSARSRLPLARGGSLTTRLGPHL
ncbi:urease accessory protein UreD [Rhodococcus wratislaviensis]|uniref:Urease accessory protein UreD n=1 Tax=Rhodococcus wratislaviensis NBRC 100605 TaxID=1219028 RepID=X0QGG6_RHOWR|nr:urease accessory protein UreD [Rhodococcus wratislaviensis]GAF50657.1 urease accessory protein UreD [Rhodococcus wratislaviensis NBRC 100605]